MTSATQYGAKVTVRGHSALGVPDESAVIVRPKQYQLPLPGEGWHILRFSDRSELCVHESRFGSDRWC